MDKPSDRAVGVEYVEEALCVSRGGAYRIIRELNRELAEGGAKVVQGRVSLNYFLDRYHLRDEGRAR